MSVIISSFSFGQVGHQQVSRMPVVDVIDLHRPHAVTDHVLALVLDINELRGLRSLRQRIRFQRVRRLQHHIVVELLVHLVRHDRGPFSDEGAQPGE
jgi:hypothetical protein